MNAKAIGKIQAKGNTFGKREKPRVKDKNILFVSGFLATSGFSVHISDGLLNKNDFLNPCIAFKATRKSKQDILKLIKTYNKTRKNITISKRLSVFEFSNKTYRLGFGKEVNQNLNKSIRSLSYSDKKKVMKSFFDEFKFFADYLTTNE